MPTVLTRDQIRASKDISIEFVPVPEWSDDNDPEEGVYVRGLTGMERDSFEMAMIEQRQGPKVKGVSSQSVNLRNLRAKLIARTAVDSDNPDTAKHIFSLADVEWLGLKSSVALQRVYVVAQRQSGLSNEEVEELTIDLGNDPSDVSGSSSLLPSGIEASPNANVGSAAESSPSGLHTIESSPSETDDSTSS